MEYGSFPPDEVPWYFLKNAVYQTRWYLPSAAIKSLTQALFTILCLAELGVESFQMYSRLGCCKVCLQAYCIFLTKNIFFPSDWRYRLSSGAGAGDAFRFQWFLCTFKALLKARNVSDIGKSSITCLVPFYLVCFCVQELLDSIQSISIFYIFVLYLALSLALTLIQFRPSWDGFLSCLSLLYFP